ncbi:hypothetical protein FEMY_20790 [Ferrovum myxofaciens]|uniref:DUF4345 domain-containing protein n=1 Tax=Ferrovum myxofaciens TaxID=416213 RepID=A0A149VW24_9PROT|nr:DUF4345 family protein [Ferrovum myxofaciens]KXW57409.1 hypothetical protein FEMY_20790 [Ferrovum myxofaciens]
MLVTESAPASPGGLTDMRATYGGLSLGIGLFLGHCARTGAFRSGLLASLLMLSSAALGRLLGIYLDGKPTWMIVLLLTAEIIFSVLSVTRTARKAPSFRAGMNSADAEGIHLRFL